MEEILTIDFRQPKNVEKSYDLKDKNMLSIITGGVGDFLTPVSDVTVTKDTLTVTVLGKTLEFTNFNFDMNIRALRTPDPSSVYWGGNKTTIRDFYYNPKFGHTNKAMLSQLFTMSSTGNLFGQQNNLDGLNSPKIK